MAYIPGIDISEGCWMWQRGRTGDGYGALQHQGRMVTAHRYVYETVVGPIPEGLQLDHLCRNRACVNPAHLEPVTNRDNVLRGAGITAVNATKEECVAGHPFDDENTYFHGGGHRACKECRREAVRRYRQRLRVGR